MLEAAGRRTQPTTLLFFTESYPYDAALEQTFIEPQLGHLHTAFERIAIIPSRRGGRRLPVPGYVEIDESLAALLDAKSAPFRLVLRAISSRLFWTEVLQRRSVLLSSRALKLLVRTTGRAEITRRWLTAMMTRRAFAPRCCIAYSFWLDHATTGLGLAKAEYPDIVTVSRANGADLFEERHDPPYLPCRRFTLVNLDRLYPASEYGVRYALDRYPWFAPRCELARLGVRDPGFTTQIRSGDRFVLVSCSGAVRVKRIDRILGGVDRVARMRPSIHFEWHHFGDGDLAASIEEQARGVLPANATAIFHGRRPIDEIMEFYRMEPVGAFVNTSESEGGSPVAIMEAASCGIPIIATDVGGNPEIVSERNGALISATPSADEIAHALLVLLDDPTAAAAKHAESRRVWEERFTADANYAEFARRLARLRMEGGHLGSPPYLEGQHLGRRTPVRESDDRGMTDTASPSPPMPPVGAHHPGTA